MRKLHLTPPLRFTICLATTLTATVLVGKLFVASAQEELVVPEPVATDPMGPDQLEVPPEPLQPAEVEVLTRGPLHEALAAQTGQDPTPGAVSPRVPPEPVDELPPEIKPEGENVVWVPGYWHWDEERNDFIWVSGLWRNAPADRRWVPGHWTPGDDDSHQWVSGFWAPAETGQIEYLPEPPATLEVGPSSPAPSEQHFWTPGTWDYQSTQYVWRPGYWQVGGPDWVWVPAHYLWTPSGCIFVPGYRDYLLSVRGLAFSPVYVPYQRFPRYRYTPHVTIDLSSAFLHLFIRPRQCHFYFGDYYAFQHRHYYPWYDFHRVGRYYDPFHCNLRWRHHYDGIDYLARFHHWHAHFASHQDQRPGATLRAQQQQLARHANLRHRDQLQLARTLDDAVKTPKAGTRFVQLQQHERTEVTRRLDDLKALRTQRAALDAEARAARLEARQNRVRTSDEKLSVGTTDPSATPKPDPPGRRRAAGTGSVAGTGTSNTPKIEAPLGADGGTVGEQPRRPKQLVLRPDPAVKKNAARPATGASTLGDAAAGSSRNAKIRPKAGGPDAAGGPTAVGGLLPNSATGGLSGKTAQPGRDRNRTKGGNVGDSARTAPRNIVENKVTGKTPGNPTTVNPPTGNQSARTRRQDNTIPQPGNGNVPSGAAQRARKAQPLGGQTLSGPTSSGGTQPGNTVGDGPPSNRKMGASGRPRVVDRAPNSGGLSGPTLVPGGNNSGPTGPRKVGGSAGVAGRQLSPGPALGSATPTPRAKPLTPPGGGARLINPNPPRPRPAPGNSLGSSSPVRPQMAPPRLPPPPRIQPPSIPRNVGPSGGAGAGGGLGGANRGAQGGVNGGGGGRNRRGG